ncbi:MAG: hypothetical protein GX316_04825 [Firmicutes bacterium]|mgnify:CR=1 FL=1|nr:hypothetical protein [Bacillota bacterium]
MSRRIAIILTVLLCVVSFGTWQLWNRRDPAARLDPNAKIDPKKVFSLVVWVEVGTGVGEPPDQDAPFWQDIRGSLQQMYPNVESTFVFVNTSELTQAMEESLAKGRPPHILVESRSWFSTWSTLQLPIDRFLPVQPEEIYLHSALARVAVKEGVMAWPCVIEPNLWVSSRQVWDALKDDAAVVNEQLADASTWIGSQWQNLQGVFQQAKLPGPVVSLQESDKSSLLHVLIAASGGIIDTEGELLLTEELIETAFNAYKAQQTAKFSVQIQGTLLTDFLTEQRGIIGPCGLWLASLDENAKLRGYDKVNIATDLRWMPPSGGRGSGSHLQGKMTQISVFRHKRFQGLAYARLSMELAQMLSQRLGWARSRDFQGLPADKRLWEKWQNEHDIDDEVWASLMDALAGPLGLSPLPVRWHNLRYTVIQDILEPFIEDFVNGLDCSPADAIATIGSFLKVSQGKVGKSRINQ